MKYRKFVAKMKEGARRGGEEGGGDVECIKGTLFTWVCLIDYMI